LRISGFSFARNTAALGYPFTEAIRSVLPVCDEFVIAVGRGDEGDGTREQIAAIADPKIRIIDTVWDDVGRLRGRIYSQQTNIALAQCSGDWCFYIQLDEVVHEKYLPAIRSRCEGLLDDREVEGLLFSYKHFCGDYDHYLVDHHWYPREIRIIRNGIGIESIVDAQSFRRNGKKLKVVLAGAEIFHYGCVRHPALMQRRNINTTQIYHGEKEASGLFRDKPSMADFGPLGRLPLFRGTYPQVMRERIAKMDWKDLLNYGRSSDVPGHKGPLKYRILTFLEQKLFGGRQIGGYKNYVLLKRK
jgi:hypothetical protein